MKLGLLALSILALTTACDRYQIGAQNQTNPGVAKDKSQPAGPNASELKEAEENQDQGSLSGTTDASGNAPKAGTSGPQYRPWGAASDGAKDSTVGNPQSGGTTQGM